MQHPNVELLEKFYTAFRERDFESLAECYHEDVQFSDDVFENLCGGEALAMWHMFTHTGSERKMTFQIIEADHLRGRGRWSIDYVFTRTGRSVHNDIESEFRFIDGKIISHHDSFDFGRWARQAFGPVGMFMSFKPIRKNLQKKIRKSLEEYQVKVGL